MIFLGFLFFISSLYLVYKLIAFLDKVAQKSSDRRKSTRRQKRLPLEGKVERRKKNGRRIAQ